MLVVHIKGFTSFNATVAATEISYYHTDHLGTPQVMTDDSGAIIWQADYDPFGKATVNIETVTNNVRFPGQYFDEETNLHYNYFRYYDPSIGRYITSDPIGLRGGVNTFAYVGEKPIIWIDPYGLWTWPSARDVKNYWKEMFDASIDFAQAKYDLSKSTFDETWYQGIDKFFHCKANCEAAQRGPGGDSLSCLLREALIKFNNFMLAKTALIIPEVRCNRTTITPHFVNNQDSFFSA